MPRSQMSFGCVLQLQSESTMALFHSCRIDEKLPVDTGAINKNFTKVKFQSV